MSKLTKREALQEIEKLTSEAMALIRKAETLAEEHDVEFSFDLAYGMGGTYAAWDDSWESSDEDAEPRKKEYQWYASSQSC